MFGYTVLVIFIVMAFFRLSRSRKAGIFVDDDGNAFIAPVSLILKVINNTNFQKLLPLTLLPDKVSTKRFPPSKLWVPIPELNEGANASGVGVKVDAFSHAFRERREKRGDYVKDVEVPL
jgi:hypothetical protein